MPHKLWSLFQVHAMGKMRIRRNDTITYIYYISYWFLVRREPAQSNNDWVVLAISSATQYTAYTFFFCNSPTYIVEHTVNNFYFLFDAKL